MQPGHDEAAELHVALGLACPTQPFYQFFEEHHAFYDFSPIGGGGILTHI